MRRHVCLFHNGLSDRGCRSRAAARYAGVAPALKPWLADAEVNTDRNLRLQYLAGFGLNTFEQKQIYDEILSYRTLPPNIFSGTPQSMMNLGYAIQAAQ